MGATVDRDDRSTAIVPPPVRKLLLVSPNEWRTDLLTRAERSSGDFVSKNTALRRFINRQNGVFGRNRLIEMCKLVQMNDHHS